MVIFRPRVWPEIVIFCLSGHLETYLREVDKSVEFVELMGKVELVCEVEFSGSTVLKDIHILVHSTKSNNY